MLSLASCALLLEASLFLVLAAVSGWEYHDSKRKSAVAGWGRQRSAGTAALLQSEEAESENHGTNARHQINLSLAFACTARAALTVFVLVCESAWVPYLAVPDLAYIALYCSLIVLLAEMRQIVAVSKTNVAMRAAVRWGFNAVLSVSLLVCSARWGANPLSKKSLVLRKFLYFELGVTYLVLFVAFVYFGVQVCICVAAPSKRLFYRTLVLTLVCGLAMSTKGAFFFATAAMNRGVTETLFPSSMGRDCFEALIALEELLPSLAMTFLTARGKARRFRAAAPQSTERTGILAPMDGHGYLDGSALDPRGVASAGVPNRQTTNITFSYGSSGLGHNRT
ncbi:unnamed protein product [Pylaiella littoralis]